MLAARGQSVVSIPERVWGGLEHWQSHITKMADYVSIPERVWGGLEPEEIYTSPEE